MPSVFKQGFTAYSSKKYNVICILQALHHCTRKKKTEQNCIFPVVEIGNPGTHIFNSFAVI